MLNNVLGSIHRQNIKIPLHVIQQLVTKMSSSQSDPHCVSFAEEIISLSRLETASAVYLNSKPSDSGGGSEENKDKNKDNTNNICLPISIPPTVLVLTYHVGGGESLLAPEHQQNNLVSGKGEEYEMFSTCPFVMDGSHGVLRKTIHYNIGWFSLKIRVFSV